MLWKHDTKLQMLSSQRRLAQELIKRSVLKLFFSCCFVAPVVSVNIGEIKEWPKNLLYQKEPQQKYKNQLQGKQNLLNNYKLLLKYTVNIKQNMRGKYKVTHK